MKNSQILKTAVLNRQCNYYPFWSSVVLLIRSDPDPDIFMERIYLNCTRCVKNMHDGQSLRLKYLTEESIAPPPQKYDQSVTK